MMDNCATCRNHIMVLLQYQLSSHLQHFWWRAVAWGVCNMPFTSLFTWAQSTAGVLIGQQRQNSKLYRKRDFPSAPFFCLCEQLTCPLLLNYKLGRTMSSLFCIFNDIVFMSNKSKLDSLKRKKFFSWPGEISEEQDTPAGTHFQPCFIPLLGKS